MLNFLDRQEEAITSASQASDGALNTETFVSLSLTSIERVSPSTCLFHLQSSAPLPAALLQPIASISVCDPSLNIQRPYTVLDHDLEKGTLTILVKRYATGDMSRFIHGKRVGSTLQIRAHAPAYKVQDYTALGTRTILCIVGGTGIAVALQLAEHLVTNTKKTMPRVAIVYASRSKEEQVLLNRLEQLVQQSNGKISFMALDDQKDGAITTSHVSKALGLQQASWFRKAERVDAAATQVLVCGSDGFIAHVAGVKPEQGQGEVGGLLAQMQLNKHVWKL